MSVAQLTLELRIEHAQTLKDRRQVVRSIKDQLQQGFNISVSEMDEAVVYQSATLGVAAISRSRSYLVDPEKVIFRHIAVEYFGLADVAG